MFLRASPPSACVRDRYGVNRELPWCAPNCAPTTGEDPRRVRSALELLRADNEEEPDDEEPHPTQNTFQLRVTAAPGVIGLPVLLHTLKFTLLAVGYFTMVSIAPGW
jgi:hypothetical protein